MAKVMAEIWAKGSGIPHAGYANSVMNDEPRPHMDISGKSSPNPSLKLSRYLYQPPLFFSSA